MTAFADVEEQHNLEFELVRQSGLALSRGLAIKRWWEAREADGSYPEVVPLIRSFNPSERSYGFFGEVDDLPVMGIVQEMPFDTVRHGSPARTCEQIREFVLKYLMRVSDFSQPVAYAPPDHDPQPRLLQPFSWCAEPDRHPVGFGFEQLLWGGWDGSIGHFDASNRFRIIDLRQIGTDVAWLLARVDIHDFVLRFHPFGGGGPGITIPLKESNFLILTREFIIDETRPADALGRFGFGYALLKTPGPAGVLAYGPGHFRAGFQNFEFTVWRDGSVSVRMAFVVDRPERILNLSADPLDWMTLASRVLFPGAANEWRERLRTILGKVNYGSVGFDPVLSFIAAANLLTGNYASETLCISKRQLELDFLVQHFMQHYQMIVGALSTWSQVPDWTTEAALPAWMESGVLLS